METWGDDFDYSVARVVPTRWGNQLNGNCHDWITSVWGTPGVPTRWGNQLNGNGSVVSVACVACSGMSPLAGETN